MLIQVFLSVLAIIEIDLIEKFPSSIGKWTKETEILKFTPDNLFDYIDGEAERYLPYNFQLLVVFNYKHQKNADEKVEIQVYQMGSTLDAFGIYSVIRDPKKEKFPYGDDGFIGGNQAMFYQSKYFVKLLGNSSSISGESLKKFGEVISNLLPKDKIELKEYECLLAIPEKVDRTEKYLAKDVLSQTFFPKGLTLQVKVGEQVGTAFIIMYQDPVKANDGWDKYVSYLEEIGANYDLRDKEVRIASPASEIAVAKLIRNRIVGIWMPGGDLEKIEKIYSKIASCLEKRE